jgi:hypothetical protein
MGMEGFMKQFAPRSKPSATSYSNYEEKTESATENSMEGFVQNFGNVTEEYEFQFKNDDGTTETVKLRFDKTEHVYYRITVVDGVADWVKVPGVTSVLGIKDKSQALMPWVANETVDHVKAAFLELSEYDVECLQSDPMQMQEWLFSTLDAAKKAYKDKSKQATDVGHATHDWIEKYIKAQIAGNQPLQLALNGDRMTMDERAISCSEAALGWMRAHSVRWVMAEEKVYSRKYDVAGTLDGVCYVSSCDDPDCCPTPFKDSLSLIDWKSSNALQVEYRWQMTPYKSALKEWKGLDIERRWVIQLGKHDGAFNTWHIDDVANDGADYKMDLKCFESCLELVNNSEHCVNTLRDRRRALKAAKKAAKDAAEAAEKARKAEIREGKKSARIEAKARYKTLRSLGNSVAESERLSGEWLDERLRFLGDDEVEDEVSEEVREAA